MIILIVKSNHLQVCYCMYHIKESRFTITSCVNHTYTEILRSSEWRAATPLIACEPTMHKCDMLMRFSGPSSTRDIRRIFSRSPGHFSVTFCEQIVKLVLGGTHKPDHAALRNKKIFPHKFFLTKSLSIPIKNRWILVMASGSLRG